MRNFVSVSISKIIKSFLWRTLKCSDNQKYENQNGMSSEKRNRQHSSYHFLSLFYSFGAIMDLLYDTDGRQTKTKTPRSVFIRCESKIMNESWNYKLSILLYHYYDPGSRCEWIEYWIIIYLFFRKNFSKFFYSSLGFGTRSVYRNFVSVFISFHRFFLSHAFQIFFSPKIEASLSPLVSVCCM